MKMFDLSLLIIVGIVIICTIGGLVSICFLGPNNPIEEIAEEVIKDETGIVVDLSPKSSETTPVAK